ncbi:hypothetical protein BBO99_00002593 [Phytophthora kernoviae]|uniref:Uncharacterized protein n=2 Tax=Phytophthora kernoviae TaxID=325452 RepID=A0A3R7J539_9STRA|nr:hypothetical protein G195_008841 [Phytophthora kernoviae 00238/432]KAG2527030.1 hypothetical protein JM18_004050 [Phytophthora kernoviae]KAG2529180.1 hypothetical protein JM16_002138 [Phytophthora kernoviae]RLN21563.1 hypothetical protein BBI17_002566 [Phytophthora kernoviae]RLN82820.1 hypothetical protein BBO99_00002593 [Phytophthora kernoviae]
MGGPYSEIPTGRVYDTPPDASDEQAYDTLEKAYNAAFWVASPESKEGSEHPHNTDRIIRQDERDRSTTVAKTEAVKKDVQVVKDESLATKSTNDGESVQ